MSFPRHAAAPFWTRKWSPARARVRLTPVSAARVSQVVSENLLDETANARVSQVVLEVLCSVLQVQPVTHISM